MTSRQRRKKFLWRRALVVVSIAGLGALAWDLGTHVVAMAADSSAARPHVYVSQPGDTLWSIAVRFAGGGDPRALVDQLESQIGGGALQPGERLYLP
jgi:LysM domain